MHEAERDYSAVRQAELVNNGRFEIDFTDVSKEEKIAASVRSANASNDMLENLIKSCLFEHQQ